MNYTALLVGAGLVVFPEPSTTATGLALITASVGYSAINSGGE